MRNRRTGRGAQVADGVILSSPDEVAIIGWNVHVGGGDVVKFVHQLQSGALTGRQVSHYVLMVEEAHRAGGGLRELPPDIRVPKRIAPKVGKRTREDILIVARTLNAGLRCAVDEEWCRTTVRRPRQRHPVDPAARRSPGHRVALHTATTSRHRRGDPRRRRGGEAVGAARRHRASRRTGGGQPSGSSPPAGGRDRPTPCSRRSIIANPPVSAATSTPGSWAHGARLPADRGRVSGHQNHGCLRWKQPAWTARLRVLPIVARLAEPNVATRRSLWPRRGQVRLPNHRPIVAILAFPDRQAGHRATTR